MKHRPSLRGLATVATLVLVLAACGDDTDTPTGDLPPATTGDGEDVTVEPACLPDEPDCDDMIVVADEGQDLDSTDDGIVSSTGMTVDGGLTVDEALALGPDVGVIAVKGFFHRDATGAHLCGVLAESFPPQCGGAALVLDGPVDEVVAAEIQESQGVQWTDDTISLFGTIDGGVLTLDVLVTG